MKDVCTLCDKQVSTNGIVVLEAKSGQMIHGDCYKIWLVGKLRGDI